MFRVLYGSIQELINNKKSRFVPQNILTICADEFLNQIKNDQKIHAAMMMMLMMMIRKKAAKREPRNTSNGLLKKKSRHEEWLRKREKRDQQHVKLKLNKNNSSVCSRAQFSLNSTLDRVGFVALFLFLVHSHQVIKSYSLQWSSAIFIWWSKSNKKNL